MCVWSYVGTPSDKTKRFSTRRRTLSTGTRFNKREQERVERREASRREESVEEDKEIDPSRYCVMSMAIPYLNRKTAIELTQN